MVKKLQDPVNLLLMTNLDSRVWPRVELAQRGVQAIRIEGESLGLMGELAYDLLHARGTPIPRTILPRTCPAASRSWALEGIREPPPLATTA